MIEKQEIVAVEDGGSRIFLIRGHKVMLDEDLAALYELETEALNLVVANNIEFFTEDLMFQLNPNEFADLKSRFAISNREAPNVFTGQGLALLSSILFDERESNDDHDSCAPSCSCRM